MLALLVVVVLTRSFVMLSYPLGGNNDDNQTGERYLIHELVEGNWRIGNLRYAPGYPLLIAPVTKLAKHLGRMEDRVVLLFQVSLSALIPFLLFNLLRQRRKLEEAFVVALVVGLDPFGIQWPHFSHPTWLTATGFIAILYFVEHALSLPVKHHKRRLKLIGFAGAIGTLLVLARNEIAFMIAVLGFLVWTQKRLPWQQRLHSFLMFGIVSAGLWGSYLATVHHASTGTYRPSCVGAINLLESLSHKNIPLSAENGPNTRHLLNMLTLQPDRDLLLLSDTYPYWRIPGPWTSQLEQITFFNQPFGKPEDTVEVYLPVPLIYYLGPCRTDTLLLHAGLEALQRYPARWISGTLKVAKQLLFQGAVNQELPSPEVLPFRPTPFSILNAFGFRISDTGNSYGYYTGQYVWKTGMEIFSAVFVYSGYLYRLTPFAILWAIASREGFYRRVVVLLLLWALLVAAIDRPEPRIYGELYPLHTVLIGGLIYQVVECVRSIRRVRRRF